MHTEMKDSSCKYIRRLYNLGQYWCSQNHNITHCDESCPFRVDKNIEFTITVSTHSSTTQSTIPYNIYKTHY